MNDNILVTRSSMPELTEYVDEISELWETHWLTNMGVKHEQFRSMLKEYLNVPQIELLTNGHMALEMALQACNFEEGSEVITTPFTFASTTHAIVRNGLVPVFCDIKYTDYTIDEEQIENLITDRTVAILPVHVYGNICNYRRISEIAEKYGLKIIYDAAHTFGESVDSIGVGNLGDASIFSFHATKVFNTIEGGAVSYKEPEYGQKIYTLKNFGIRDEEIVDGIGANAKMNEFCAAMGICNLRHIDDEIAKRKLVYERYFDNLSDIPGLKLNTIPDNVRSNYAYFPIVVDPEVFGSTRDEIKDRLADNGIGTRKYFYPIASEFDCYKNVYDSSKTPVALDTGNKVLTLPMYADIDIDIVDRICSIIRKGN